MPIAAVSLIDGLSSSSSGIPPRTLGALGISLSLLTSLAMAWTGPVGSYVRGNYYVLDQRAGEGAVNAVRYDARIVSDFRMLAYLVPGNTLYWEGTVGDATGCIRQSSAPGTVPIRSTRRNGLQEVWWNVEDLCMTNRALLYWSESIY